MDRRELLRSLACIALGTATAACTPLRIVTRSFPEEFEHDLDLVRRTLDAFAVVVVPGVEPRDPARVLRDHRFPFAPYASFFASDLAQRARRRFAGAAFERLPATDRVTVVQDGLRADGTTRKLYRGAIYLTQIALYSGIYDDDAGCALIDFHGRYRGDTISYDDAASFLPQPLTPSGNVA